VRADLDLEPQAVTAIAQRHVAILCYDETDEARAVDWIRRLSTTSLRSHVVVDVRTSGRRSRYLADAVRATERTRERTPAYRSEPDNIPVAVGASEQHLNRAMSCVRRGRHAAGERWLRAAVESGRRRGDEEVQARAGRELAERLLARDELEAATDHVFDLLGRFKSWHARVEAADIAARVLIASGDLSRADGLLGSIGAEAAVLGQVTPLAIRLRRAQVRFWQGRFEEATIELGPEATGPEGSLWRTLIEWARGDCDAQALTAPLAAAVEHGAVDNLLASACAVEVLMSEGRASDALERLGTRRRMGGAMRLELALADWLRSKCLPNAADAAAAAADAEEFIRRSCARGITRWGLGRTGMHLLHAIPALLHIVHDAEDDIATLTRGTAWIRGHAGAEAAAVLTHDGGRVIAGAGFTAADLEHELVRDALQSERPRAVAAGPTVVVTSPVQLAGATIGLVVARGPSASGGTLAEASMVVASLCAPALRARLDAIAQAETGRSLVGEILGTSPAIQALRESIARAAATFFPVLIEGESGTGKELVARAVHRLSARRDRRFCAINCAALTDELVEAELFGHTRGAFTGAVGPRAGLFEDAHGGTLFLDEVGELSARAQAKLLRVLQEREIRRVGENVARPVDIRLVAATNRALDDAVQERQFRDDLRFRISVVRFRLPPLRERLEDVPLLAHAFWRKTTAEVGKHVVLGPDAVVALTRHSWPGNIRELQNAIAALAVIAPSRGRVQARHVMQVLSTNTRCDAGGVPLDAARRTFERQVVTAALVRHAGRRGEAARELGLSRQGLTKAIKRLGVDAGPDAEGVA